MVYSTRRFVLCLTLCYFVLVFFSPFSIAITSLGEEKANLSAFRTFVRFALVYFCLFPLPLGVWEGLRFVIVALPGLFSYLFLSSAIEQKYLIFILHHINSRQFSKTAGFALFRLQILLRHVLLICHTILTNQKLGNYLFHIDLSKARMFTDTRDEGPMKISVQLPLTYQHLSTREHNENG